MELDALIRALAPGDVVGRRAVEIRDLAYDTRDVHEGALFFCVPGATRDGHDLAPEAVADGAVALVVERPPDRTLRAGRVALRQPEEGEAGLRLIAAAARRAVAPGRRSAGR